MRVLTIVCHACDHCWKIAAAFSLYEQQAVESRPCPACERYTLTCPEPVTERPGRGQRDLRTMTG